MRPFLKTGPAGSVGRYDLGIATVGVETQHSPESEPAGARKAFVILGWMLAVLPAGYMVAGLRQPNLRASNATTQDASAILNLSLEYINGGQPGKAREVLTDLVAANPEKRRRMEQPVRGSDATARAEGCRGGVCSRFRSIRATNSRKIT